MSLAEIPVLLIFKRRSAGRPCVLSQLLHEYAFDTSPPTGCAVPVSGPRICLIKYCLPHWCPMNTDTSLQSGTTAAAPPPPSLHPLCFLSRWVQIWKWMWESDHIYGLITWHLLLASLLWPCPGGTLFRSNTPPLGLCSSFPSAHRPPQSGWGPLCLGFPPEPSQT